MTILSQRSFSSGEISPTLYARVDTTKYATGLRTCKNWIVQRFGGASTRPGLRHIGTSKFSGNTATNNNVRLIPFAYTENQRYILEFGNLYMRVIKEDEYVLQSGIALNDYIFGSNTAIYTAAPHGLNTGDQIYLTGRDKNQDLLYKTWSLKTAAGTTLQPTKVNTNAAVMPTNGTGDLASTDRSVVGKPYEIVTPYLGEEVFDINYVQSEGVLSLVHPNHAPRELTRTADNSWTLSETAFAPDVAFPENVDVSFTAGANTYNYMVTAIDADTGEESIAGIANIQVTNITNAVNGVVTTDRAHGLSATDWVRLRDVGGMTEVNDAVHLINSVTATTITLATNTSGYGTYTSGGKASPTIYACTYTNPARLVTISNHGLSDGDVVYVQNVVGPTEFNDRQYVVDVYNATQFSLRDVDSSGYTSPITAFSGFYDKCNRTIAATDPATNPHTISWDLVPNAVEYNIYKEINGIYGQIGIAQGTQFVDDVDISANTSFSPPLYKNPFIGTGNYPSCVTFIQQRKAYANTINNPEKIWLSRTGNYNNFTTTTPLTDSSSFSFSIAGRQANEVKNMLDLGRLVILTTDGEWSVEGNDAGVITPSDINAKQYTYNGSSNLRPIVIQGTALYNQARGSIIRDLAYSFEADGYSGNDLTIFSNHLFDGYTIVDWAYQQIPHSIVWVVRSDGALLGLTYVKDQGILAWHRHSLDGQAKAVAVVPGDSEDILYVAVSRSIPVSSTDPTEYSYTHIEKMTPFSASQDDQIFMDSANTYLGDSSYLPSSTITLSGGTTWGPGESLTLTCSIMVFIEGAEWLGRQIHLTSSDGTVVKCTITKWISNTSANCNVDKTVPTDLRASATTNYAIANTSYHGLNYLEGKQVAIYGDGVVEASPNNAAYIVRTVTDGYVSWDTPLVNVKIGLPITSDLETLDIDTPSGESMASRNKLISRIAIYTYKSRGVWVGPKEPSAAAPLDEMIEFKTIDDQTYELTEREQTRILEVTIRSEWSKSGRVFIRQVDPIPATIGAIHPIGKIPFSN